MAMNSRDAAVAEVPFRCAEAMRSSMPLISLKGTGGLVSACIVGNSGSRCSTRCGRMQTIKKDVFVPECESLTGPSLTPGTPDRVNSFRSP